MSFLHTIFLFFIYCFVIYIYFRKQMDLFQQAGIPYIKPWPIVGNMLPIILKKMSIPDFIFKLYNLNPNAKYVGFYEYERPIILLRDPEIIKLIGIKHWEIFPNRRGFNLGNGIQDPVMGNEMFSAKYDKWQEMKKSLSPAYTPRKLKLLTKLISQQTKIFLDHILKNEEAVDINSQKYVEKYMTDIINACSYGIVTNCVTDENEEFYNFCHRAVNLEELEKKKQIQLLSPLLWKFFKMSYLDSGTLKYFRNIVEYSIAKRKNADEFSFNLIDLLIDSSDKRKINIEDITAQTYLFFAAGFDTTAPILSYLFYHLAINPNVQEKIQNEIFLLENKYKESFQPTLDDINDLKYLDAAIKETLRIHSLLPLERESVNNFQLPPALPGLKSFTIKPGTLLLIPIEAIHHDKKYFKEPEKFKPERFLQKNSFSILSFGIGQRKCFGNRLALLIIKLFFFHILIRCNIRICSKTPIPLNMSNCKFTRIPGKEIWLRIEKRQDK